MPAVEIVSLKVTNVAKKPKSRLDPVIVWKGTSAGLKCPQKQEVMDQLMLLTTPVFYDHGYFSLKIKRTDRLVMILSDDIDLKKIAIL